MLRWVVVAALLAGCSPSGIFDCQSDAMCGGEGACEADGFCSFPDDGCPSGRRYGEQAPASLAGVCVLPMPSGSSGVTTSAGTTAATTTSMTTLDPDPASTSSGDASASSSSDSTGSTGATTTGGEDGIDVEGELIELPEGWEAGVWFDFSEDFAFTADAYPDPPDAYTNLPQNLFVLPPAFDGELGIVTVHTIIELGTDYTERSFFGITGDGPDAMYQAVDCSGFEGMADSVCVSAGSQGGGDGIFVIAPNWTMTVLSSLNNSNGIGFDPSGVFDNVGVPALYIGTPPEMLRYPDETILGAYVKPRQVLADGSMALVLNDFDVGLHRLVILSSVTHEQQIFRNQAVPKVQLSEQNPGAIDVVTGDPAAIPGYVFALVDTHELTEYDDAGGETVLASSEPSQGWRWASAVVPPLSHPLSGGQPTFYILESNRDLDRDRVIWLRPPE